ncbi:uncharacterized protein B0H18DRAFT_1105775 [Fomitopsis serialis]|uniref:uncharacterized protein n=1 Tax=Fomitopsis serialis TaxID=139415 RepID=UPI002007702F|nr:uncharacterized protein B0H18DRAFT_1105775 [Neoantrodia serialis]KAH9921853.1 hypothetical protein B0H18DRAFT_1105775 [Neoantrodia serialis]
MSTSTAEAIAGVQAGVVQSYIIMACTVFAMYDYLLTVGSDITLLWLQRAPFGMTVLMGLIRFTAIGMSITLLASILYLPTLGNCRDSYVISSAFALFPNVLDAVISAIRAYAVSNRSLVWAATVFATDIFTVIVNVYNIATTQYQLVDVDGTWVCKIMAQFVGSTAEKVTLVGSIFNVLSQAIVAGLTWSRLLFLVQRSVKDARVNPRSFSISWFFLRDGTVYFMHVLLRPSTHAVFLYTLVARAMLLLQLVYCLLTYLAVRSYYDYSSVCILISLTSGCGFFQHVLSIDTDSLIVAAPPQSPESLYQRHQSGRIRLHDFPYAGRPHPRIKHHFRTSSWSRSGCTRYPR